MAAGTVIVFAAHGSRSVDANDAHRALAMEVAVRLDQEVVAAFLELAEPSIGAAIDGSLAAGATRVVVLPYFLHPGNHTTRDIPAIVAEARHRHPDALIDSAPLFGSDAALAELVAAQARAALG